MKNKFKIAMLSLLLIPCLLLATACTKDLSVAEYNDKVKESAITYYQNKDGKNMTISSKQSTTATWKSYVYFGENDEYGENVNFEQVSEKSQVIEFYTETIDGYTYKNIKVTDFVRTATTGKEENDEETGLKDYMSVEETTTVTTIVGTTDSWKAYTLTETKEDNEDAVVEKEVYTYLSLDSYLKDVEEILSNIDSLIFENTFFGNDYLILLKLYGAEATYFAEGDDVFGSTITYSINDVDDKVISEQSAVMELTFEDNLPSKISATAESISIDDHIEDDTITHNNCTKANSSLEIKYSANKIVAPEGFGEAQISIYAPSINIQGLSMM